METQTMKETETTGGVPETNSWDATAVLAKFLSLSLSQDPATGSPNLTCSYPFPVPCDLETPMCPPAILYQALFKLWVVLEIFRD